MCSSIAGQSREVRRGDGEQELHHPFEALGQRILTVLRGRGPPLIAGDHIAR
jgi:hypothetical protein